MKNRIHKYYAPLFAIFLTGILVLTGCGGGSGTDTNTLGTTTATKTFTGVVYPVVVGLSYKTDSKSGVVSSSGSYTYKNKENITFSIGGIELATKPAAEKVTPLPLDNDVAATNLLRLFKALDSDGALSNGVTLPTLVASSLAIDLNNESSVVAALASLSPTAILPSASDADIATALASAKTTAMQNSGTYGLTYTTIIARVMGTPLAYHPKSAVVNLTSQPNWSTEAVTGTVTLTLNDNSEVTFAFNATSGTYTALGNIQTFTLKNDFGANSRVIHLYYGVVSTTGTGVLGELILRDNSQPNMPPVAAVGPVELIPMGPAGAWTGWTHELHSVPTGPGEVMDGSKDFDGMIVSQSWSSSKGKTGIGNTFSESFLNNETGSITLTVTDDEGASSTKTYSVNKADTTIEVTGSWSVTEKTGSNTCGEPTGVSNSYPITITATGNSLSVSNSVGTFSGAINGNAVSWAGSYPEDGGTTTITALNVTVSADKKSFIGASSWSWTDGSFNCTGSSTVNGVQLNSPSISAPTVTGLNPSTGTEGSTVTITGTNFSTTPANNTVKFNGTQTTVTAATTTSLSVTVPTGATSGTVTVTTASGSATSVSNFTVLAASTGTMQLSTPIDGVTNFDFNNSTFSTTIIGSLTLNLLSWDGLTAGHIEVVEVVEYGYSYLRENIYFGNGFWASPCCAVAGGTGYGGEFGTECSVSCSSLGITFNKETGTLTNLNAPIPYADTYGTPVTENFTGTLRFTPY